MRPRAERYTSGPVTGDKQVRWLPLAFAAALGAIGLIAGRMEALVAAGVLLAWFLILLASGRLRDAGAEIVLRRQHYLQMCAQSCVLLYWGWYWRPVYEALPMLLAQVLFAYGFDLLLSWSRRERYTLGFGPVPVVFSINLFLWFKAEWFGWQFAIVGLGLAAKSLIRWEREGRRVHIFNPSSFPLAIASLALLATGNTGMTWGPEIASTQFYPPQMYLLLFLIGLPGQFFFGVTTMTLSAVLSTYLFGLAYFAATGIYFFYDSYIPIAVFLGMHLLFTDPSTSPRTEAGRILFGCLYGLSTVALYQVLGSLGLPMFYDKLLQVPVLNLSVRAIDRMANRLAPAKLLPQLAGPARNAAYMGVWAVAFVMMSAAQGVGDRHPGQWMPFWRQACADKRAYACPYYADMTLTACRQGSSWACNEAGLMHLRLAGSGEDSRREDEAGAAEPFERGCQLGLSAACYNVQVLVTGQGAFRTALPSPEDLPTVLRGSKGPITERDPEKLVALACQQGWNDVCPTEPALRGAVQ
ncbi:MAG: hypothetical protein RL328_471 [Acidobacteriota bacterium]